MYEQINMIDQAAEEPAAEETKTQQAPTTKTYYEINEETARRANDMNSMRDYKPGSATAEYRAAVDQAAELVERQKKAVSPFYHDKLDALLDRYARRLAAYYNDYYSATFLPEVAEEQGIFSCRRLSQHRLGCGDHDSSFDSQVWLQKTSYPV